jgi:hypothetical protein
MQEIVPKNPLLWIVKNRQKEQSKNKDNRKENQRLFPQILQSIPEFFRF